MTDDPRAHSRLPQDSVYWERLSSRAIEAALGPALPQMETWWRPISERAFALAAAAVVAMLAGSLLMGARQNSVTDGGTGPLAEALAPDQPLLATMLEAQSEPPSAALLFRLMALREGESR